VAPSGTTDLYDAIAPIYDEWQSWNGMTPFARVAAAKLAPLLDREAATAAARGRDRPALLDVGCGTGTLLAEVRRAQPAWRLAGVDASAGMLAVAQAKLLAIADDVLWARAGLEALPFVATFDVCSIFYDTLNHLPDAEALARTLAAAAATLRPGGLVVFDVTSRHGFEDWWDSKNKFGGAGWSMSIDARFDRANELATGQVTFERAGASRRFVIHERYFAREDIAAALATAGFQVEAQEAWSPFPIGGLGKAWWVARLR
jgi:SAM-dependent methyltransferase